MPKHFITLAHIAATVVSVLFTLWLIVRPPVRAESGTLQPTASASQCLALVGQSFIPCNEVEPHLYPEQWLARVLSI